MEKERIWKEIRGTIKDRLLRMGLISNIEKNHSHALDCLADDIYLILQSNKITMAVGKDI